MSDDFEFIQRTLARADEKRAKSGETSLRSEEQVAETIWSASGIIGNGSFQYFFECGLDAEDCAHSCEVIGLPEAAQIFRLALSLFPDSTPHEDVGKRVAYVEEREEIFDKLGMEIVRLNKKIETHLSAYLKNAGFQ